MSQFSETILTIDTSYLIYRSYFAYPKLSVGPSPIGAFFGFAKTILALVSEYKPKYLVFANDLPDPTWRHEILETYKAGRAKIEDEMAVQIPIIKDWCQKVGSDYLETSGFEADDLIATVAVLAKSKDMPNLIFSADRDLYQLLDANTKIVQIDKLTRNYQLFGQTDFEQKFGLEVWQWLDYKTLVGDPSDNLAGLSGVGPKTAVSILNQIGSLRNLLLQLKIDTNLVTEAVDLAAEEQFVSSCQAFVQTPKNANLIQKITDNLKQLEQVRNLAKLQILPDLDLSWQSFDLEKGLGDFEKYKFQSLSTTLNKLLGKTAAKSVSKTSSIPPADDNALF